MKEAKNFTDKERGAMKYKYYRRNAFWRKVSELILAGYSSDEACDLIYNCYGHGSSVTKIINLMSMTKRGVDILGLQNLIFRLRNYTEISGHCDLVRAL